MWFGILGDLEVTEDGRILDLGRPLQRVLLAYLVLERDRSVAVDTLVDLLWDGDRAPADPKASVQTYIARLRRILQPDGAPPTAPRLLVRSGSGYRLAVDAEQVDVAVFDRLADDAGRALRAGRPADAADASERALRLWRMDRPVPELAGRRLAQPHLVRLGEARLGCAEDRSAALLELGRAAETVADLERLVAEHPLRERCWQLLMQALYETGRAAEALERYNRLRIVLSEELGLEPGVALRALHLQILRGEPVQSRPSGRAEPAPVPLEPAPESGRSEGALLGRDSERAEIAGVLAALPAGGPAFVLVEGEPGIGKSSLARDTAEEATRRGFAVAWGRCHEDDDRPAFWPWRQVLIALGVERALSDAGSAELFATFEAVLAALATASTGRPLLVVLDDLQWADPASLRLVSFLAVELNRAPVVLLVTCRRGIGSEPVSRARAALARAPGYRPFALGPLDAKAIAELVRRRAGAATDAQAAQVHARSGGNPFFAGELATLLVAQPGSGGLPAAVVDVVDRRLGGLPDAARRSLEVAAVVGERFGLDRLLAASGSDLDRVADGLDAALEAGLVRPDGNAFRFGHALIREAVLAGCGPVRRRRLHAQVATAGGGDPVDSAFHLWAGQPFTDPTETVAACAAAAALAERDLAHDTAAEWWQRAIDVAEQAGDRPSQLTGQRRRELRLASAAALTRAGRVAEAQPRLAETIEDSLAVGALDVAVAAARLLTATGGNWVWVAYGAHPARLVDALERTLAALPPTAVGDRVGVLGALAIGYTYSDPDRAVRLVDQSLALARASGRSSLVIEALACWMFGHWRPGEDQAILAATTELVELAVHNDQPAIEALARIRRANALIALCDFGGAEADLSRAEDWAQRSREPLFLAQLTQLRGMLAGLRGNFDQARQLIATAHRTMERVGYQLADSVTASSLGFLAVEQRRADEFAAALTDWQRTAGDFLLYGNALLDAGRPAEALVAIEADAGWQDQPPWWNWIAMTCWQADLAVRLADRLPAETIAELADRLAPYAGTIAVWGAMGSPGLVDRHLGGLLAAAGRRDEAIEVLERALADSVEHGLRPSEAAVSESLAGLIDDPARRAALLGRAAELGRELDPRRVSRAGSGTG